MSEETPTTESGEVESKGAERPFSLLANEMFPGKYFGEVEQPENKGPEPEGPNDEDVQETPDTEGEDGQDESVQDNTETEEQAYELSHVAQLLGVEESNLDVDDDGHIVLQGKVDGEPIRKNLKDLLSNVQMYEAADRRLEEAKSKREALTKDLAEKSEAIEQQYATAAKLIENLESYLNEETSKIDWKALREDDPAEYSAKKADVAEKRERIERMKQEAIQEYTEARKRQHEDYEAAYKERLVKEGEALLEKLPEWADEKKAEAEKAELAKYLQDWRFTGDDLRAVTSDHRAIILVRKAMLYDKLQAEKKTAEKKVARVPKVLKPGTPKPQEQVNKERLEKHRAKLKKSGKFDDALELLRASRQS